MQFSFASVRDKEPQEDFQMKRRPGMIKEWNIMERKAAYFSSSFDISYSDNPVSSM